MALSDLFAPGYNPSDPASVAAVNAWNAAHLRRRPTGDLPFAPAAPAPAAPAPLAPGSRDAIAQALMQQPDGTGVGDLGGVGGPIGGTVGGGLSFGGLPISLTSDTFAPAPTTPARSGVTVEQAAKSPPNEPPQAPPEAVPMPQARPGEAPQLAPQPPSGLRGGAINENAIPVQTTNVQPTSIMNAPPEPAPAPAAPQAPTPIGLNPAQSTNPMVNDPEMMGSPPSTNPFAIDPAITDPAMTTSPPSSPAPAPPGIQPFTVEQVNEAMNTAGQRGQNATDMAKGFFDTAKGYFSDPVSAIFGPAKDVAPVISIPHEGLYSGLPIESAPPAEAPAPAPEFGGGMIGSGGYTTEGSPVGGGPGVGSSIGADPATMGDIAAGFGGPGSGANTGADPGAAANVAAAFGGDSSVAGGAPAEPGSSVALGSDVGAMLGSSGDTSIGLGPGGIGLGNDSAW